MPPTVAPSLATLSALSSALSAFRISPALRRHASHQAQGRANGAKDGAGKRLGAKKTGGEYVVPGNILFKQRGTHWFPGDHCFMVGSRPSSYTSTATLTEEQGRDHTIHAGAPGYVRYYRDPARHPKRQFIGLVFEKDQVLPQPTCAVRRRKLGMLAYQMPTPTPVLPTTPDALSDAEIDPSRTAPSSQPTPALRPSHQYRAANWEIGRSADIAEAAAQAQGKTTRVYPAFKRGDRFAAWRKSSVRLASNRARKAVGKAGKRKK